MKNRSQHFIPLFLVLIAAHSWELNSKYLLQAPLFFPLAYADEEPALPSLDESLEDLGAAPMEPPQDSPAPVAPLDPAPPATAEAAPPPPLAPESLISPTPAPTEELPTNQYVAEEPAETAVPEAPVVSTDPEAPPTPPQDQIVVNEPKSEPEGAPAITATRKVKLMAYQRAIPVLGVEMAGSASALGRSDIAPAQSGIPARAFSLHFDYQPEFIQSAGLGVLGFGPSVGIYPMVQSLTDPSKPRAAPGLSSNWQLGGQLRYQARFFREQPLVPMVGFVAEYLNYYFNSGTPKGRVLITGPVLGLGLLLNILEPNAAADFYINQGFSRSYLVAELRSLSGSDANVTISGSSFYFGIRIEH